MTAPFRLERRTPGQEPGGREASERVPPQYSYASPIPFLALLAAVVALLAGSPLRSRPVVYQPGDIARQDVKAARDFLVPDEAAGRKRRQAAEDRVPAVYDFDPAAAEGILEDLGRRLESLRPEVIGPQGPVRPDWEKVARELEGRMGAPVRTSELRLLMAPGGTEWLLGGVRSALEGFYTRGVVANRRLFLGDSLDGLVVRDLQVGEERNLGNAEEVVDFDEAIRILSAAEETEGLEGLGQRLAAVVLRPNMRFNSEVTADRRRQVREAVRPVLYQIRRGEMLVREGDRVSPEQSRKLAAHAELVRQGGAWKQFAGMVLLTFGSLLCLFRYGAANIKKFRCRGRDALFLSLLLVGMLAVERLLFLLTQQVATAIPATLLPALMFAVPLGAAVLAVRVVLNSETAILFAVPYFALAAFSFEHELAAFLCFLVGGLAGAHQAARACQRVNFLRAGVWIGLGQAGVLVCVLLLEPGVSWEQAVWWPVGAFAGGLISGLLALGLVPLAESVLGYTTDMRLMELASLDHPVLRQLMLRAPGTYHHSIVTGSLVKAAAEAIGARALLATVASYYHDIGKINKPAYFIENQSEGGNRHDKLSPSMSSLILTSHVKDGVEMARKHRLGDDIVAIIRQHHGTSLIRFFFDRAKQRVRGGAEEVREQDYRYPGPKPQSREAALVLLADAVEAASRTIPDPRPARVRGMVQNIITRTFADGQLDECDLTLKDLHQIAGSFSRILVAIRHQRIDYPLPVQKEKRVDGDLDSKRLPEGSPGRGPVAAEGGEAFRRLGL